MVITSKCRASIKVSVLQSLIFVFLPTYGLSVSLSLPTPTHSDIDLSKVDPVSQHCFGGSRVWQIQ